MEVAVVGVGRSDYSRSLSADRSPLSLAADACRAALSDAGLEPTDVDGFASYAMNDSATFGQVAYAIGVGELTWNLDVYGGGTGAYVSVQAAKAALEQGDCSVAVVFRSLCG